MSVVLLLVLVLIFFIIVMYITEYYGYFSINCDKLFKLKDFRILKECNSISIVGPSCTGKSSLARKLKCIDNDLEIIELDYLYWLPNWRHPKKKKFRNKVKESIAECVQKNKRYIIVGSYKTVNDLIYGCDVIIYLNYTKFITFVHGLSRTLIRMVLKYKVCNDNTERFNLLFTEDSVPYIIMTRHDDKKNRISTSLSKQKRSEKLINISCPYHCSFWLKNLIFP